MKQCPKCSKEYTNDAGFCLTDGSPLMFVASNPLPPPQNSGAPNIFAMPNASNALPANNAPVFQPNQNAPSIFTPSNNNAGFQNAAAVPQNYQPAYQPQPPNYQPAYQQAPPMPNANKNSGLRIVKKVLLLAAIPIVLMAMSFFFRLNSVRWYEFIPVVIGAIIVVGGLGIIGNLEKK